VVQRAPVHEESEREQRERQVRFAVMVEMMPPHVMVTGTVDVQVVVVVVQIVVVVVHVYAVVVRYVRVVVFGHAVAADRDEPFLSGTTGRG